MKWFPDFFTKLWITFKAGIDYFIVYSHVTRYGAAGSLMVLLLWIYISSSILIYFGAAFKKVYACLYGRSISASIEAITERTGISLRNRDLRNEEE